MTQRVLIFGATGYTGTALVKALCAREDTDVFAHVRVGSSSKPDLETLVDEFDFKIVESSWDFEAIAEVIANCAPTVVFSTLGTTKKRKRNAENKAAETYQAVDYGLTATAIGACTDSEYAPTFVYLSSAGVSDTALGDYLQTRLQAEKYLQHSELPYLIARPSFISGSDRNEFRPAERIGSVTADVVLGAMGLVGFVGVRDKYQSMTATELASALVAVTFDEKLKNQIIEARELRRFS